MSNPYYGVTYSKYWCKPKRLKLWRRKNCRKNMHLFDEVWTGRDHYLVCDACGLTVHIAKIEK